MKYIIILAVSFFSITASADVSDEVTSSSQDETESAVVETAGMDIQCEDLKRRTGMPLNLQAMTVAEYRALLRFICGEKGTAIGTAVDKQAAVEMSKISISKKRFKRN